MISYRRFRREAIQAQESPSWRNWFAGMVYQIRARLVHHFGGHTYQTHRPDGDCFRRCSWCGHSR
jgi:hypothetical protein